MTKIEKLSSGASLMTYDDVAPKDFEFAFGNEKNIEVISNHIEKYIGPIDQVFHEIISDQVHIDVFWVKPSETLPYNILVTSGMSDRPMTTPEVFQDYFLYAELFLLLPPDWPLDMESLENEDNYWPMRWLKQLARFPHEYETFFCIEHTVGGGDPPVNFSPNCPFCGFLFYVSPSLPDEFQTLQLETGETIHFYCLIPLYKEEIDLKNNKGLEALLDRLEAAEVSDVIDIHRKNSCPKKKGFFGLW